MNALFLYEGWLQFLWLHPIWSLNLSSPVQSVVGAGAWMREPVKRTFAVICNEFHLKCSISLHFSLTETNVSDCKQVKIDRDQMFLFGVVDIRCSMSPSMPNIGAIELDLSLGGNARHLAAFFFPFSYSSGLLVVWLIGLLLWVAECNTEWLCGCYVWCIDSLLSMPFIQ